MAEPRITLMVTDLHMPKMDGIELAMLAREIAPNITVVMMTGDVSVNVPQMAAEAGVSKMLAKPFNPPQLLAITRGRNIFSGKLVGKTHFNFKQKVAWQNHR